MYSARTVERDLNTLGQPWVSWWRAASTLYDKQQGQNASRRLLNEIIVKKRPSELKEMRNVFYDWYRQASRRVDFVLAAHRRA